MNFLTIISTFLIVAAISANAQTAVLFGATGAVGSEVQRALLSDNDSYWENVILIGRKLSSPTSNTEGGAPTNVSTIISLPDLSNIDQNIELLDEIKEADACFIAIGIGDINLVTLEYWHSIEVDMIASITRFCDKIQVRYISLLSAIDVDYKTAEPFSHEEIHADNQTPLGWMMCLSLYYRVKGLEEKAVITSSKSIPHVRLFQPSTIVTQEIRYGWIDWVLFRIHKIVDPYIPTTYHSVDVRLLGMAMVADAIDVLQSSIIEHDIAGTHVAKLTYADFLRVAGDAFNEQHQQNSDEL